MLEQWLKLEVLRAEQNDPYGPVLVFRRNVFLSFQEDDLGIRERALIGMDNLMWGSDYPHAESTWPNSRQIIDHILQGVPEDEKRKIVCGNAARLYCFD